MPDRIKVPCPKCGMEFKVPANTVRAGMTLTCEFCKTPLRITEQPEHEGLRKALSAARKIRRGIKLGWNHGSLRPQQT